jgi:hypothetical protein
LADSGQDRVRSRTAAGRATSPSGLTPHEYGRPLAHGPQAIERHLAADREAKRGRADLLGLHDSREEAAAALVPPD